MKYEIKNIDINSSEFFCTCFYVEQNINRENLSKNGGTLNYSNLTYNSDILFIAYDGVVPVGYNSVVKCDLGYYIYQIAVKKEYQNKGIGTEMLKRALEIAEKENKSVVANVMNYNKPSQKMFKKLGFEKISENDKGNGLYILNQINKTLSAKTNDSVLDEDCINIYASNDMTNFYITDSEIIKSLEYGQEVKIMKDSTKLSNGLPVHELKICIFNDDVNLKIWSVETNELIGFQQAKKENKSKKM